jgi:hypothetical protein
MKWQKRERKDPVRGEEREMREGRGQLIIFHWRPTGS